MNNLPEIFSRTNIRFLELLIDKDGAVRELAEKAKCSAGKASQAVKKFQRRGIVTVKNEKNRKIVHLNRENPLTRQIVSLILIERIVNSSAFRELKKKAVSIGVYGSVVEGTVDGASDIDLWVLAGEKLPMVEEGAIRRDLSKELGREASLKVFTRESLNRLRKSDKIFFNELKNKSRVLHGEGIEQEQSGRVL